MLFATLLIQCCVLIVMFWPYKGGSNSLNTFANITTNSFESLYILDSNSNSTLIGFANNPGKSKTRLLKELEIQIKNIIGEKNGK